MATTRDQVVIELVAQTQKAMGSLKKFGLAIGAIIATVKTFEAVAKHAFESTMMAGALESQAISFEQLAQSASVSSDDVLDAMQRMTKGTISTIDLMRTASQANLLGIGFTEMPKLLEIARASALATGQTMDFMFQSIVTGVGRASPMILDNLGIILKIGEANKIYAEQIGKTVDEMTTADKKQAILNATLIAGEDIIKKVGTAVEDMTAPERMDAFKVSWQELRTEIGKTFLPILLEVADATKQIMDNMTESLKDPLTEEDFAFLQTMVNGTQATLDQYGQFLKIQRQVTKEYSDALISVLNLQSTIAVTEQSVGKGRFSLLKTQNAQLESAQELLNTLEFQFNTLTNQRGVLIELGKQHEENAKNAETNLSEEAKERKETAEQDEDMATKRERILGLIGTHEVASLFNLRNQLETLKQEAEWLEFVEKQGTNMVGWSKDWGMAMTVVLAKTKATEEEIRKIESPVLDLKTGIDESGFDIGLARRVGKELTTRINAEEAFRMVQKQLLYESTEEQKQQLEEIQQGWQGFFDTLSQGALVNGVGAFREMGIAIAQGKDMTDAFANSILRAVADAMQLLAVELAINGARAIGMGNVGLGVSMLLASAGVGLFGGMLSGVGGGATASSAPGASTMGTASTTQNKQPARTVVINNTTVSGSYIASRNVGMRVT